MRARRRPPRGLVPCSSKLPSWNSGSVRIAWRATSLNAMFCAERFGAAAITSAWRRRVGIADRPVERLHAAEASAHHGGPLRDAELVGESRLRVDPVLDGDQRKLRAPRLAGRRIDRERPGRAEAAAEIVDAHDEEAVGVERLARPDHVVPPADVVRIVGVVARHVMRRVERMADEHRVVARRGQRPVGLVGELERRQARPAGERQRRVEAGAPFDDRSDRRAGDGGVGGRAAGGRGKGGHAARGLSATKNPTSFALSRVGNGISVCLLRFSRFCDALPGRRMAATRPQAGSNRRRWPSYPARRGFAKPGRRTVEAPLRQRGITA